MNDPFEGIGYRIPVEEAGRQRNVRMRERKIERERGRGKVGIERRRGRWERY